MPIYSYDLEEAAEALVKKELENPDRPTNEEYVHDPVFDAALTILRRNGEARKAAFDGTPIPEHY